MAKLGWCLAVLFCCCSAENGGERTRYDGYKVLQVIAISKEKLDLLRAFQQKLKFVFWQEPIRLDTEIHFLVPLHLFHRVTDKLLSLDIPYRVHHENVQQQIEAEIERHQQRTKKDGTSTFNINDYNTYNDIITWLEGEAKEKCPQGFSCTIENIGKSYDGHDLKLFKVTKSEMGRKIIWSDSLIHARDWIAGTTLLKLLDNLLSNYDIDPEIQKLLDKYDFYFLPVMNPDGYTFSWNTDRLWSKSRNVNTGSSCIGTDLNRNFEHHKTEDRIVNVDPCEATYRGTKPASEPETKALQNYLLTHGMEMRALVSLRGSGQRWLFPYGNADLLGIKSEGNSDHDKLVKVGNAAANATQNTFDTTWQRGTFCESLYPAAGGICAFAYERAGIKFCFAVELRGPDLDSAASAIEKSSVEVWNGYKAMLQTINDL